MTPSDRFTHRAALNQRGFSLIELMVTVAIVAILATIAVPGMTDLIKDSRLSAQTDSLVTALNAARMEAIKQRTDITFCPASSNANTDTACSTSATWDKGWLVLKGTTIIQRYDSKTNVSVTPNPTSTISVTFRGTLGSATAASTFNLCVPGRKQQSVSIVLSGHVAKSVSTSTTCS